MELGTSPPTGGGGGWPGIPAPEFPSLLIPHMYPLSVIGLPMPWSRALVAVA